MPDIKMLKDAYFTILQSQHDADTIKCRVSLNAAHPIYAGHFPGNPVCPGICSIMLVRECVNAVTDHSYKLSAIKDCRFPAMMSPDKNAEVELTVKYATTEEGLIKIEASLYDEENTFLTLKATLSL